MASSSSAKKVARVAARSSGSSSKKQANWLFPAAIFAIVVLGVGIVALARNKNPGSGDNTTHPIAQLTQGQAADHWHNAFAINVCGKELPALTDAKEDVLGIHTHGDGLMHIHPFSIRAAGKNATLGRFFDQTGLQVTDQGFKLPGKDGAVYQEGKTTCGGKPAQLVVAHWKNAVNAVGTKPDNIYTKNFRSIRMTEDLGAFALAFEVKGTKDFPVPSSSAGITNPSDVAGSDATGTAPIQIPTTGASDATATTAPTATTAGSGG